MAYVSKQIPEDEQNQTGRTDPTTPNPAPEGGGSAGTAAPGGNAIPGVGTSTQFGSNAAKLSDYLKANQGQVEDFGNEIAGKLTQGYNDTLGSIDQGANDFNQQVNQGYAQYDPTLVGRAGTNPNDFTKNQDDVSKFQSIYNDQYKGPNDFESTTPYSNINSNVNKAVENASLVKDNAGLSTYLSNAGYYPNASQGVKSLDTALLMGNQNAQKSIRDAASPYSGLSNYLSGKVKNSDTGVATAKDQANQIRQNTQNQFTGEGGYIPSFQNQLNQKLTDSVAQATGRSGAAKNALGLSNPNDLGNMPDTVFSDLGIDKDRLMQVLGQRNAINSGGLWNGQMVAPAASPVDLSSYLGLTQQTPDVALNAGNVASSDDYAKAAAFQKLTGNDMSGFLNPENSGQAGTANLDLSSINPDQIGSLDSLYKSMYPTVNGPTPTETPIDDDMSRWISLHHKPSDPSLVPDWEKERDDYQKSISGPKVVKVNGENPWGAF